MLRRHHDSHLSATAATLLAAVVAWSGCSGGDAGGDEDGGAIADVDAIERVDVAGLTPEDAPAGHTLYHLEVERRDGERLVFDRDVSGEESYLLAFSDDGTGPTVELRFTDATITLRLFVLELDLGVVDGGGVNPVHTDGVGSYVFDDGRPALRLTTDSHVFDSRHPDAHGDLEVTDWASREGGAIAGRVDARLVAQDGDWMDAAGWFQLILPRDFRPPSHAPCDLLDQDCAPWEACYWVDNPPGPVCLRPGSAGAGGRCDRPNACAPGFMCRSGYCRRLCDVRTPECNIEYECSEWFGEAGFCAP